MDWVVEYPIGECLAGLVSRAVRFGRKTRVLSGHNTMRRKGLTLGV